MPSPKPSTLPPIRHQSHGLTVQQVGDAGELIAAVEIVLAGHSAAVVGAGGGPRDLACWGDPLGAYMAQAKTARRARRQDGLLVYHWHLTSRHRRGRGYGDEADLLALVALDRGLVAWLPAAGAPTVLTLPVPGQDGVREWGGQVFGDLALEDALAGVAAARRDRSLAEAQAAQTAAAWERLQRIGAAM